MTLFIFVYIYAVGCALTALYCRNNLRPEDVGEYYKSAVVVTVLVWPLVAAAVGVLTVITLWQRRGGF